MYKIKMDCMDPPYKEAPYADEVSGEFEHKDEALLALLDCVIDEASSLNAPDENYFPRTNIFVILRDYEFNGKKYDAAIIMWDGTTGVEEQFVTGYYIEWVNSNVVDEWNRKLRDRHGDEITVRLCSELGFTNNEDEEDGEEHEVFFYTTASFGDCDDRYATIEEAYREADDYLNGLDY